MQLAPDPNWSDLMVDQIAYIADMEVECLQPSNALCVLRTFGFVKVSLQIPSSPGQFFLLKSEHAFLCFLGVALAMIPALTD